MTARTMLLSDEEIRDEAEEFTVNQISTDSFRQGFRLGAEFSRPRYEAERNRLLDEIERLKASLAQWEAFRKKNPFLSSWDGEDDPTISLPEPKEGE